MSKSPLSGLLTAAFGEKTTAAAATLDKMERRTPTPIIALVEASVSTEVPATPAMKPSHDPSNSTSHDTSHDTSDGTTDGPSDGPSLAASNNPSIGTSHNPSIEPSHGASDSTSHALSHDTDDIFDPVRNLNRRQGAVLYYLINRPGSIAQRQQIMAATGIPLPTIRDNIVCLTSEGFITKPVKYVYKSFQGFTYQINLVLCDRFIAERGSEFETNRPSHGPSHEASFDPSFSPYLATSDGSSDGPSDVLRTRDYKPLEEEALNLLPSKTVHQEQDTRHTARQTDRMTGGQTGRQILSDPEHLYWKDLGLTEKKVSAWMKETEMDAEEMDLSLRYARFAFLKEPGKAKSPIDLFYTIIKRDGCFLKPADYKSLRQIRIERAIAEREARIKEDLEEERLERELAFDRIFQDKQGPEFLKLKAQVVNPGGFPLSGKMLESAMREAFLSSMV